MNEAAIHELLVAKMADAVVGWNAEEPEAVADIAPARIAEVATFLRDEQALDFDQLMCLSGIDWDGLDEAGKGKSVAILGYDEVGRPETSDRVAEGDLGVIYHLYSHLHQHKFTVRVRVPRDAAEVPTVSHVWPTAAWHEREAWDLVGVRFAGHADLRRILLDDEWEGHPLRKDYQMPDTWGSVPLAGKDYAKNPYAKDPEPEAADGAEQKPASTDDPKSTGDA